MDPAEKKMREFGQLVVRLQQGEDLTREESHEAYRQIWRNEQNELQQGAFIAAHRCKGPTVEELVGLTESHNEEWKLVFPDEVNGPEPHAGILGVGMKGLKTPNVSSAAAVIAAACGAYVHKAGAPALTGVSGCHDAFVAWGVDTDISPARNVEATRKCRLGFTSVIGKALLSSGILRVVGQLRIGTCIHMGGPAAFHSGERHKITGVPDPQMARLQIELMRELGYVRAMCPCGTATDTPGEYIDEFSNAGPTHVTELKEDGSIEEYAVTPADVGLVEVKYQDIQAAPSPEENVRLGALVLAGKQGGPVLDLFALNAAAILQLMDKAPSLKDGVEMARTAVTEGKALAQLEALINAQNRDPEKGLTTLHTLIAD
ncbi:MAG: anthranilate phosphoribosyltransferase [Deltaproteobacteria bacterium]|nr:anthranilate phosphoribosyltransferase [Deltaproteobacteria bacterium]